MSIHPGFRLAFISHYHISFHNVCLPFPYLSHVCLSLAVSPRSYLSQCWNISVFVSFCAFFSVSVRDCSSVCCLFLFLHLCIVSCLPVAVRYIFHLISFRTFKLHPCFSLWFPAARFQFCSTTQNYAITYLSLSFFFHFFPSFSTCLPVFLSLSLSNAHKKVSPPHMPVLVNVSKLTLLCYICADTSPLSPITTRFPQYPMIFFELVEDTWWALPSLSMWLPHQPMFVLSFICQTIVGCPLALTPLVFQCMVEFKKKGHIYLKW